MKDFVDKPIRGYNKWEMLYPDRCMMKWKGMLLSDHTEHVKDYQTKVVKRFEFAKDMDPQQLENLDFGITYALRYKLKIKVTYRQSSNEVETCVGELHVCDEIKMVLVMSEKKVSIPIEDVLSLDFDI